MTTEHRLVFDLSDIRALRIECTACNAAISVPLDQRLRVPAECPSCRATLKDQFRPGVAPHLEQLAELMKTIAPAKDVPVRLRLEVDKS